MYTVRIKRDEATSKYTAGKLFVAGLYFCDTLEDPCRDLNHNGRFDGGETKVPGDTCIPQGTFRVTFETTTLAIGKQAVGGKIPLVHDVPDFTSIRIHSGNTPADTRGCVLLGRRDAPGHIADSLKTTLAFYEKVNYEPFLLIIEDNFELD